MKSTYEDCLLRLPNGRQLSYALWGDPKGRPVVLMHGWPGSRLAGRLFESVLSIKGIRLIVPDRPGIGRSEPLPGSTLLDWANDITILADSLALDRFAIIGYSGGAPYGLACAYRLGNRLTGIAVVSGMGPIDTAGALESFPPHLKAIFVLCRRIPAAATLPTGLIALGVRYFPEAMMLQARVMAAKTDRAILARRPVFEAIRAEYTEAFRQGVRYVAHEASIYARPWGFALERLQSGIHLYHGKDDRFIPISLACRLAKPLPFCRPRFIARAGHFWIVDHFGEVLDAFAC